MRLLDLTIHNFGVFRGTHVFELASRRDGTKQTPLTIFRGYNGTGKSTLFQSLSVVLYGALALGDRVTATEYENFLRSRWHQWSQSVAPSDRDEAGLELSFEYVYSAEPRPLHIHVARRWRRQGKHIREMLTVLQDGRLPDVDPSDYQAWINDFFPPNLLPLCFFDAEQLEALSNPDHHYQMIVTLLHRFLGIDEAQRLQNDLEHFILRPNGAGKAEHLRTSIHERRELIVALDDRLANLQQSVDTLINERASLNSLLLENERTLAAEGGSYAARRSYLQERRAQIKHEQEEIIAQIYELSAGLLPFSLAPHICQRLNKRLMTEMEVQNLRTVNDIWRHRKTMFIRSFKKDDFWQGVTLSSEAKEALIQRLALLAESLSPSSSNEEDITIIHPLSEPDRERIMGFIAQILNDIPQQVGYLGERLRILQEEEHRIEHDFRRVPDEAILIPIQGEIEQLTGRMRNIERQLKDVESQVAIVRFQREDQVRRHDQEIVELTNLESIDRRLVLANKAKTLLRTYADKLLYQRIVQLEKKIVECFNVMCCKENLLEQVTFDLSERQIKLWGISGRILNISDFSAGERQLYALACLWALRQMTVRRLPLFIDMPFARLDENHRQQVICQYIPSVSDQVVLFVTDAELTDELYTNARPYLKQLYELRYNTAHEETEVRLSHRGEIHEAVS